MNERIEKKMEQIAKIERRIAKWEKVCTEEQIRLAYQFRNSYSAWVRYAKEKNIGFTGGNVYELRSALADLDKANEQLEKIKKQEEKKADTEATINDMPESMKEFAKKVEDAWNSHDKAVRELYRKKYKELGYKEFIKTYKYQAYEMMYATDEEFAKANHKAMETLIINLFNRVIEKTGKITDSQGLVVTQGNNGYAVINGFVKGEKGTAVVESIGAGGYNIQKYHIRTLVK